MLAQRENEDVRSFKSDWMLRLERDARREGKQEGKREGKQEGMQELLLRVLEQRFGSVPEATRRRVKALEDPDELTRWVDRTLTAESLEELGLDD